MIKTIVIFLAVVLYSQAIVAQETQAVYEEAIKQIKSTKARYEMVNFAASKKSVSFKNQAYAFWLDGEKDRFKEEHFEEFFGDFLYTPIKIKSFKKAGDKRRSKFQLFVTETVDKYFVIELLKREHSQKPSYPNFYQGQSISFLFEKTNNGIKLLRKIILENN